MKAHLDIAHSGTVGADDRTRMTFDENSIAHLMSVLTDLYSDPAMAVIREYSTNARDAHRSIGSDAPIEVTTPTMLSPTFAVRDYGPGLSITQITDNFSKYGWSSKRDSDDEVGMLGLGCKSALSYTSQFTLVSRHAGLKITVLVTRDNDGCGVVQIIDTTPTDEPSGVEVQVPSKNNYAMMSRVEFFFGFWDPATVLVDGQPPKNNWRDVGRDGVVLDDDVVATRNDGIETDFLVMGDVPYPINNKILKQAHDTHIIAWVPIGSIDFTPSREALHYTKRTEATIKEVKQFVAERGRVTSQRQLDACATRSEAAYLAVHLGGLWGDRGRPTYRGEVIPSHIGNSNGGFRLNVKMPTYDRDQSYKGVGVMGLTKWLEAALLVTDYTPSSMQAGVKDRARAYCESLGIKEGTIYFLNEPVSPWLESVPMISYADLRQFGPAPTAARRPTAPKSHYRVLRADGTTYATPDRPDKITAWIEGTMTPSERAAFYYLNVNGGEIVVVNKSVMATWLADEPDVPHVGDIAEERAIKARESITPWEWYIERARHDSQIDLLQYLVPRELLDPELAELARIAQQPSKNGRNMFYTFENLACRVGKKPTVLAVPDTTWVSDLVALAHKRYPLISHLLGYRARQACIAATEAINAQYILREQLNLIPIQ